MMRALRSIEHAIASRRSKVHYSAFLQVFHNYVSYSFSVPHHHRAHRRALLSRIARARAHNPGPGPGRLGAYTDRTPGGCALLHPGRLSHRQNPGWEGSRTFIELGKPVSVQDLILGMIVQSGNDATIALAERVAGTEETFAQLMNANAARLGMTGTHFENSSGLPSPNHYTTAHDMALLAIALIRDFPQFYKYFSVREFEYNGIKQQNRNGLLEKDSTVDGLKTGHTDSAGFCLVTSSLRDGMRLISVVLGSSSLKGRENASAALLNYGFTFYDTKLVARGGAKLASAPVWKAASTPFDVGIDKDLYITLPRSQSG